VRHLRDFSISELLNLHSNDEADALGTTFATP
jgi:hypothetical protein